MELTLQSLHADRDAFLAAGYKLPEFDYDTVHKNTTEHPYWIHFGAGNIFRAFQANVAQNLLNDGILPSGLPRIPPRSFPSASVRPSRLTRQVLVCMWKI